MLVQPLYFGSQKSKNGSQSCRETPIIQRWFLISNTHDGRIYGVFFKMQAKKRQAMKHEPAIFNVAANTLSERQTVHMASHTH